MKSIAEQIQWNHDYIVNKVSKEIPTYFIRYEDLVLDPEPALTELFCFLFDVKTLHGTVLEKRIKDVARRGNEDKAIYALKDTTYDLNKNKHMYNESLLKEVGDILKVYNLYFGYANINK